MSNHGFSLIKNTVNFGMTNSVRFVGSMSVDDSYSSDGYTGNIGNDEYELNDIFDDESDNLSTSKLVTIHEALFLGKGKTVAEQGS